MVETEPILNPPSKKIEPSQEISLGTGDLLETSEIISSRDPRVGVRKTTLGQEGTTPEPGQISLETGTPLEIGTGTHLLTDTLAADLTLETEIGTEDLNLVVATVIDMTLKEITSGIAPKADLKRDPITETDPTRDLFHQKEILLGIGISPERQEELTLT